MGQTDKRIRRHDGDPQANSAFHPSGVSNWVPASAGKVNTGTVHSVSGWTRCAQVKLWDPLERVPYLSALEVCSRQGTIQIHVYFPLPYLRRKQKVQVGTLWTC